MLKRNTQSDGASLRSLTDSEIEFVVGGVKAGPNGEGCTGPRGTTKGGTKPVYIPPTSTFI
jgi:hypothetical protein